MGLSRPTTNRTNAEIETPDLAFDSAPRSPFLHEWLFTHATRSPGAPAVATPTDRLTFGELALRVRAFAAHLAASGVGPGSRVLLALPNGIATIVAGLAVNAVGGVSVEVSRAWSMDMLGEIAVRSGVHQAIIWGRDAGAWGAVLSAAPLDRIWLVHHETLPSAFRDALSQVPTMLLLEDGRVDPELGSAPPPPERELQPDWPALVMYTSGSTGTPHGVVQTYRNVDANSRSIVRYLGLTAADRALITLPLSYCYGRSVLQTHLLAGGSVYLDSRMAFPRVVLEALASEQCTGFAGVPLTFEVIRRQVDVGTIAFPHLRYVTQAGGAMAPDTIEWVRAQFSPAQLFIMYGQTEATARLAYLPPDRAADKPGSIGQAIPGVELQVMDASGRELPPGEIGELVARGANVTPGYLDDPAETALILHDGWLWTGDLARRDADGDFYLQGRVKEILKIGGHRVSPVAIEQVIMRHPDISDAAVYGLPDDLAGEVPAAVFVNRSGTTSSQEELERFCRERLPARQVPVSFVSAGTLPRNESGKLLRAELAVRFGKG